MARVGCVRVGRDYLAFERHFYANHLGETERGTAAGPGGMSTHSVLSPSQTVIAYALSAQRNAGGQQIKINPDAGMLATTSERERR